MCKELQWGVAQNIVHSFINERTNKTLNTLTNYTFWHCILLSIRTMSLYFSLGLVFYRNEISASLLRKIATHSTYWKLYTLAKNEFREYSSILNLISYHDIVLLCSRIHLKWISLCYCAKTWRQNYLSRSHFEDDSSPYISWSRSSVRISHTFALFKNVTFTWINYLETWLHSDNTSCYYINTELKSFKITLKVGPKPFLYKKTIQPLFIMLSECTF